MAVFVSIPDSISMILLGIMGAFLLRTVDPIIGTSSGDTAGAVPLIFPFVFTSFIGFLYDVFFIIQLIIQLFGAQFIPPMGYLVSRILALIARVIVIVRLSNVARMIIDPREQPPPTTTTTSSVLLVDRTRPQFQAFSGQGNVLSTQTARE
jgi:hypothetical protein